MPEIEEYVLLGRDPNELVIGDIVRYRGTGGMPSHSRLIGVDCIVTALVPGYSDRVVKVDKGGNTLYWGKDVKLVKGVEDA